jgi:hypothetical protein
MYVSCMYVTPVCVHMCIFTKVKSGEIPYGALFGEQEVDGTLTAFVTGPGE